LFLYKEFGLAAESAKRIDEGMNSATEEDDHTEEDESEPDDEPGTIQRFMKHVQG
jgi:hypothetical protein